MRLTLLRRNAVLVLALTGCTSIPFANDIPMWSNDPDKIARLGKGASAAAVDAALGRTRVLWTHDAEVDGKNYQFRLYDWVEHTSNARHTMLPYAIVYEGAGQRLYAWGTLAELRDSGDPVVIGLVPRLREQYGFYKSAR